MSIECGVVLAFLTNRFLVLDGNTSPPANIVDYGGRVDNTTPSRVTDLIDIPVPWGEPDELDLDGITGRELTEHSMMDCVFYVPGNVDITSSDAESFANGRQHWLCESDDLVDEPMLMMSENPIPPGSELHRTNLSFYSYFFYLDAETRRSVHDMLARMKAKAPYAALASKVANDLGDFNAVHMRRGDFKVTYGVTVLDRQPWEAVEALDHHFKRDDRLVIVTDERDDPFFDEIKAAYPDHVFIDHHILDHYGDEFDRLPCRDSLALAHLSQLIAGESMDFIGSMTSTFSSMIQRYRGNSGRDEPFKFLWNELPDPQHEVKRGSHPVSDCVPLDNGVMVEEFSGPYSWNRYSRLLNPSWMREWPESFLGREPEEATSDLPSRPATAASKSAESTAFASFEGLQFSIRTRTADLADVLAGSFGSNGVGGRNVMDELSVDGSSFGYRVRREGEIVEQVPDSTGQRNPHGPLLNALGEVMATRLATFKKHYCWFRGMAVARDGKALVIGGDVGPNSDLLFDALRSGGWTPVADRYVAIRMKDWHVVPFMCSHGPPTESVPLSTLVVAADRMHNRPSISGLSPSIGVAELIPYSVNVQIDRKSAIERLCKLVSKHPVYELTYGGGDNWDQTVEFVSSIELAEPRGEERG